MEIASHKLKGVPFKAAHSSGGEMAPTLIVLHDTAGRLEKGSSVAWFCSKDCNTSAHVVIERDGSMTQLVPFNKKAWHAGKSQWKGRSLCNSFSIGIEIVNPGCLDKNGKAWFGQVFPDCQHCATKEHGAGKWMPYTPEQIEVVTNLCRALALEYAIEDITTHWFISPKRKVDPNPLFPLDQVKAAVFMRAPLVADLPTAAKPVTKTSRKAKAASAGEQGMMLGGVTIFGLTLAQFLGYARQAAELIRDFGVELTIAVLFIGSVAFAAIKHFTKQDHEEGRYVPSGEAEDDLA